MNDSQDDRPNRATAYRGSLGRPDGAGGGARDTYGGANGGGPDGGGGGGSGTGDSPGAPGAEDAAAGTSSPPATKPFLPGDSATAGPGARPDGTARPDAVAGETIASHFFRRETSAAADSGSDDVPGPARDAEPVSQNGRTAAAKDVGGRTGDRTPADHGPGEPSPAAGGSRSRPAPPVDVPTRVNPAAGPGRVGPGAVASAGHNPPERGAGPAGGQPGGSGPATADVDPDLTRAAPAHGGGAGVRPGAPSGPAVPGVPLVPTESYSDRPRDPDTISLARPPGAKQRRGTAAVGRGGNERGRPSSPGPTARPGSHQGAPRPQSAATTVYDRPSAGSPPSDQPGWSRPDQLDSASGQGRPAGPSTRGMPHQGVGPNTGPSGTRGPGAGGRRARLTLSRVNPLSVTRITFAFSLCAFVVVLVAVAVLWFVLNSVGVFDSVVDAADTLTSDDSSVQGWLSFSRAMQLALLIGAINVVLMTALATLSALLYNLCADMIGGVEVTLSDQ